MNEYNRNKIKRIKRKYEVITSKGCRITWIKTDKHKPIRKQEEFKKPRLTKEQITFFLKRFRKLDVTKLEHRKQLINTFINAIYLYDDKLVLIFNYKDSVKTASLKEIEGSDLTTRTAPKSTRFDSVLSILLFTYSLFTIP